MSNFSYRPDVDGLRSVAVLPVLLFHAGFSQFSGGFVGVDVFFVISGFLITSIIHKEMIENRFSMTQFWARRARRILPAAFAVVLFTLIVGWFLLSPRDYFDLGRSARYQALFSANFLFFKESGYFDTAAELKPLLHTWSLAVEEQFYFIFPLLLLAIHKLKHRVLLFVLVLISIISFSMSVWGVSENPSATFYLLHTRAWELLAGSLIALIPGYSGKHKVVAHGIGLAGIVSILAAIFLYDSQTAFPGPAALLPVLGAAAIIWAGPTGIMSNILAWRPLVWIGLLSYSLYLWHWPLIVFTHYWYPEELVLTQKIALIAISFLLAWLSWKFIEGPFRDRKIFPTKGKILFAAFISIVITAGLGQSIRKNEGFRDRLPDKILNYAMAVERSDKQKRCIGITVEEVKNDKLCRLGNSTETHNSPKILVWGDSHADSLIEGFDHLVDIYNIPSWHAAISGCPPLLGLQWEHRPECEAFNNEVFALIKRHQVTDVLLATRWSLYYHGRGEGDPVAVIIPPENMTKLEYYKKNIHDTITQLREHNVNVWILNEIPGYNFNSARQLTRLVMRGREDEVAKIGMPYKEHYKRHKLINVIFSEENKRPGVTTLDPAEYLCPKQDFCITAANGMALYRDGDHLSLRGSVYLNKLFRPIFE